MLQDGQKHYIRYIINKLAEYAFVTDRAELQEGGFRIVDFGFVVISDLGNE
jgi:hypothetical protein